MGKKKQCPSCHHTFRSGSGLRRHINVTPECLASERANAGLVEPVGNESSPHTYRWCVPVRTLEQEEQEQEDEVENQDGETKSVGHDDQETKTVDHEDVSLVDNLRPEVNAEEPEFPVGQNSDLNDKDDEVSDPFPIDDGSIQADRPTVLEDVHHREGAEDVRRFLDPAQPGYRLYDPRRNLPVPDSVANRNYNNDNVINASPNTSMRDEFRAYCAKSRAETREFSAVEAKSVRLLGTLKRKKAPLDTYDEIMEWHHRESGNLNMHQPLGDLGNDHLSRKVMLKRLKDRYNMSGKEPTVTNLKLPFAKAKVKLTRHNAWDCIQSLLTDPRVKDEDYNFLANDPLAVPEPPKVIGDLQTAYFRAHQEYIKKPKQVLLPIVLYIDGANTGQFKDLPITALKMALGIHTRAFRDKPHAWRTLGNVAAVRKAATHGTDLFAATGHLDAGEPDLTDDEDYEVDPALPVTKAQDFHTMLDCLLETFREVQTNGFMWDLRYRGKTYKDIEFVPFCIFIKCDAEEGDLLCGSYTHRLENVKQLCRYCLCPTWESDLVKANFPTKTTEMIALFILTKDEEGLKEMSQQNIVNAFYKLRFGPHNTMGVHGACPSEMLHAVLLGIFKYTRDSFFEQIGPTSDLAVRINALAQKFGDAFGRQSERDMPKCKFKAGIRRGKIMAKEFRGILLVIAAILRSQKGRSLLKSRPAYFTDERIQDWITLVEMLLQWEAFLCRPEMKMAHVKKLQRKNRYLMYVMKRVANRTEGMGLKLTKFHVIVHMWRDILYFGVPMEFDTGSNESGHKETKVAAKLTQKNESTFDFQTCVRLDEFLLIDLAVEEMTGNCKLWKYFRRKTSPEAQPPLPDPAPETSGAVINIFNDADSGQPVYSMGSSKKSQVASKYPWDTDVIKFLWRLQSKLGKQNVKFRAQHRRNNQLFRGSPKYRTESWRDWAIFDWGDDDGELPGHIWCFVVVTCVPEVSISKPTHGGIDLEPGTFAVVESASWVDEPSEIDQSDMFIPINKEVRAKQSATRGWKRRFYLADVESIKKPLVVVPDIGGKEGVEYLVVKERAQWSIDFSTWLDAPNDNDVIGPEEPIPSHGVS